MAITYHVELREDRHYYSVPHHLRRRDPPTRVKMVYDDRVLAIYWDNVRVVQHQRDRTPGGYTTLAEHIPDHHRFYAEWSPERFQGWAAKIGAETAQLIAEVLASVDYPPQAFRRCLGILNLARRYGSQRLNAACAKALTMGVLSYKRISTMLALKMEQDTQPKLDLSPLPMHENVRGGEYFKLRGEDS